MIRAECRSHDSEHAVRFDATPFFEGAGVDEIVAVAVFDWERDEPLRAVARFVADLPGYGAVARMLEYVTRERRRGDFFSCSVHGPDALRWLRENRPDVVEALDELELDDDKLLEGFDKEPYWEIEEWDEDYCVRAAGGLAP